MLLVVDGRLTLNTANIMKTNIFRTGLALVTGLLMSALTQGCGTLMAHSDQDSQSPVLLEGEPRFYRGVAFDAKHRTDIFDFMAFCDLPFSFVADTLMIPMDAKQHYAGDFKVNEPTSAGQGH